MKLSLIYRRKCTQHLLIRKDTHIYRSYCTQHLLIGKDTHIPSLVSECIPTSRRNVGRPRRKWRQEDVQYEDGANRELLAHEVLAAHGENGNECWALSCSVLQPVLKNTRTVSVIVPCVEYPTWIWAVCGSNTVQYLNVAQHKTVWILPCLLITLALCAVSLCWRLIRLFLLDPPFHHVTVLLSVGGCLVFYTSLPFDLCRLLLTADGMPQVWSPSALQTDCNIILSANMITLYGLRRIRLIALSFDTRANGLLFVW